MAIVTIVIIASLLIALCIIHYRFEKEYPIIEEKVIYYENELDKTKNKDEVILLHKKFLNDDVLFKDSGDGTCTLKSKILSKRVIALANNMEFLHKLFDRL